MDIYLVRHTIVAPSGICYGQQDVPLATSFPQDAVAVREKLPGNIHEWPCYTSPSQRCQQLARHLVGEKFRTDARLMELSFGAWENRPWDSISADEMASWSTDFVHVAPPDGESFAAMAQRSQDFWHDLKQGAPQSSLIITHAGWIRAFVCQVLELSLRQAFHMQIDYGGVTRVRRHHGVFRVEFLNR